MFKNKKRKLDLILIFLVFSISALLLSFLSADNIVTDSLGRQVPVNDYKRIGIINPAALKSLIFLGIENYKIVGVDSYSKSKFSSFLSTKTENLGDFNNPNLEILARSNLDLLILDQSFPIQKLNEIEKLKINYFVYSTSVKSYNDIYTNLFNLSRLLNESEKCERLKKIR